MSIQSNPKEKKKMKAREDDNADGSDRAIVKKKATQGGKGNRKTSTLLAYEDAAAGKTRWDKMTR
ncbi:hypothetical protein AX14_007362 [Amanita brunnescens Koide BX004]|nr:hypothetical protein AX14_007362 [Amanita brunnescens Koide BX004]